MARVYPFSSDASRRPEEPATKLSPHDRLELLRRIEPRTAKVIERTIEKAYRDAVARSR